MVCPSRPRRPFSGGSRTGAPSWRVSHRASASQHISSISAVIISSNHSHPCLGHGAMHAPRARNPITHASETSGLNRVPTGRSTIRRANLLLTSRSQRVGAAVASTSATIAAPRAPTPACFLSPAVTISPTSMPILCRAWYVCGLPRHFHRLQHGVDYLANLDAFHFEVWSQQDAMFQHGCSQRLYVLRQHEIALLERRECPRCRY